MALHHGWKSGFGENHKKAETEATQAHTHARSARSQSSSLNTRTSSVSARPALSLLTKSCSPVPLSCTLQVPGSPGEKRWA